MNKILSYIMIFLLSFGLVGCWDRVEVNDIAIVMATGVDLLPDHKLKVSAQYALPGSSGQKGGGASESKKAYFVDSSVGVDLRDATQQIQERLSRRNFVAHRRIFVIGEKLARQGIRPILDELSRNPESRLRTYVVITKGITASDLLQTSYPFEKIPMEALREIERSRVGLEVQLKDMLIALATEGQSPVLPAVGKVQLQGDTKASFRLIGGAVFKDDKLVGWLNDSSTRGILWLRNEVKRTVVTVKIPKVQGYISSDVVRANTKVSAKKENGAIVLYVKSMAEADVTENTTELDLMEPQNVKLVEDEISKRVNDRMQSTLDKIQHEYKSDVVGYGEIIHRTYPRDWRTMKSNWETGLFPKTKILISVSIKVRRVGMTGPSLDIPEKEIKRGAPQ